MIVIPERLRGLPKEESIISFSSIWVECSPSKTAITVLPVRDLIDWHNCVIQQVHDCPTMSPDDFFKRSTVPPSSFVPSLTQRSTMDDWEALQRSSSPQESTETWTSWNRGRVLHRSHLLIYPWDRLVG